MYYLQGLSISITLSFIHCCLHPAGNNNLPGERFLFQCIFTMRSYVLLPMGSKKLSVLTRFLKRVCPLVAAEHLLDSQGSFRK